jgi:hypothetical protein
LTHAIGIVACAAACGEPSVEVAFAIPGAYADLVASVSLQILVPVAGAPFSCEDLAFGDVLTETIAASRNQEVVLQDGRHTGLSGIPRLGDKIFWARGLDAQGAPVTAACAEVGDVEDSVAVDLIGEPAVLIVTDTVDLSEPLPATLSVALTDATGQAAGGVETRWLTTGPAGASFTGSETTDERGRVDLALASSTWPGPAALDVHARWETAAVSTLHGFVAPPIAFGYAIPEGPAADDMLPIDARFAIGRFGAAGQMGFAALGALDDSGMARPVHVVTYDASAQPSPFRVATTAPITAIRSLGVARDVDRDHLVTLTAIRWLEIFPDGSVIDQLSPLPGRAATALVSVGPCEQVARADDLLVQLADGSFAALGADGSVVDSVFLGAAAGRLVTSGCVAGTGAEVFRVVVFAEAGANQRVVAAMDKLREGTLATFPAGIGFAPTIGEESARLLGTELSLDGTAVARYRLRALGGAGLDLEKVTQDESPTVAQATLGGDVDGDDLVDVVALLELGTLEEERQLRLLVVLGATHRGQRLIGLSKGESGRDARPFLADFDGDGISDLLVGTATSATIYRMGPS